MKIMITGGAGFIGSALAETLAQMKHSVRVFDKDADAARKLKSKHGIEIKVGDFCSAKSAKEALRGIETVVHLACTTIPSVSNADIVADLEKNLLGTIGFLELCAEAGTKKIVFASTGGAIYGQARSLPISETHPTDPISSYGIHKLAIEKYLALFERKSGLDWAAVRAGNPYEKNQPLGRGQGAVAVFADAIKRGKKITIWGDGKIVRDYLHISDLVHAYAAAIEKPTPSKIYNVGTARGTNLKQLVKILERASGRKAKVEYVDSRNVDVSANVLDFSRAQKELGWKPKIKLENGVAEFFGED